MAATKKSNLVLIGMPGAGKSTVGVILAKLSQKNFVDTDILIQTAQRCSLQQIVDEQGYLKLREIESDILCQLDVNNSVISTGGSAVYSSAAMQHLAENGTLIYLQVSLQEIRKRTANYETRGIARPPGHSLEDLYAERTLLYERYAHLRIACDEKTPEQICELILQTNTS